VKRERLASTLTILLLVTVGTAACGRSPSEELDDVVDIGSHSLHIHCMGRERSDGSPTVVIDVGFADSYTNAKWQAIQKRIAEGVRICAYDRAGYGLSEPGPFPRSSQQAAKELKALLNNAGVEPPYVLVGHSLGGLNMQAFVSQYPDLVAGAVFLDPPPLPFLTGERFPELYQLAQKETEALLMTAEQAGRSSDPEERAKASHYQTLASEHEMMRVSAEQVMALESYGDMPLIVLASGRPNPAFGQFAEAFQGFWIEQNQALAAKSTKGTCVLAAESGHHLYADVPDMVLDAIRQVVEQAGGA
jgi:pimeloyl-ACP methyl ester carboxylesterase